jgi:hypothetical protein
MTTTENVTRLANEYALFAARKERQEKEYQRLVARANRVSETLIQTKAIMREIIGEIEAAARDSQ